MFDKLDLSFNFVDIINTIMKGTASLKKNFDQCITEMQIVVDTIHFVKNV